MGIICSNNVSERAAQCLQFHSIVSLYYLRKKNSCLFNKYSIIRLNFLFSKILIILHYYFTFIIDSEILQ